MAQFGPGRFLSDTAREDRQERVEDKIGRSARDRQVSPDVLWVKSLRMMLLSAQPTTETKLCMPRCYTLDSNKPCLL